MRRIFAFTVALVVAPCLFPVAAGPQQPVQNTLPNPADFVAAGPHCQMRVKVSPWVGTPAVDWPNTYQCVLDIHTCDGVKTYKSSVRPGGTGMCDDYWKVHDALANREICCDRGSREKKPVPEEERPLGGNSGGD